MTTIPADLGVSFEPEAIREHFDGHPNDPTVGLSDEVLAAVGRRAVEDDGLWRAFHDALTWAFTTDDARPDHPTHAELDPDGCDGCDGSGAILGMDTPEGIQRCDECSKLPGDFEAAHLIAAAYPGAAVMFHGSDGQTRRATDHTGALAVPDAVTIESETNPWVVLANGMVLSSADPEPGRNT